jgi:hypothetical protein
MAPRSDLEAGQSTIVSGAAADFLLRVESPRASITG